MTFFDDNPLVTVYLPTHNRRLLLERAVSSVVMQSYIHFELIIVDDGSTDDTGEYLARIALSDARIIVLKHSYPRGAPAARNLAISRAKGKYITGLDDDDEFHPLRLEVFVKNWLEVAGTAAQPACLFSSLLFVGDSGKIVSNDKRDRVVAEELFSGNLVGNQIFCPTGHMKEIGGFDINMPAWQDLEFFIRLLRAYGHARHVNRPTYLCYIDTGRQRISTRTDSLRKAFSIIKSKNSGIDRRYLNTLFMQIFSDYYGVRPKYQDFAVLLDQRAPLSSWIKLIWKIWKNRRGVQAFGS
ncbi:glycosyltransferase [Rhizobium rhododendri]|uniref:Glycosyltransferase n=1 Tax=Rhizobium rhododendri TaxID=2506430 RepID=A0ABY8INA3_9HYPH|nr:glycosyltransferase [Rhizobium rhododendri]WFS25213.1 glycosyltransferase [Rhizobium rhododendri]